MLEQERALLRDAAANRRSNYGATMRRPSSPSSSILSLGPPTFPTFSSGEGETTGLLKSAAQWEEAIEAGRIHTTYWREIKVAAKSAPQLYVTFALQYSLTIASVFAAGRLGKNELAGVSLGSMTATITSNAIIQARPRSPAVRTVRQANREVGIIDRVGHSMWAGGEPSAFVP